MDLLRRTPWSRVVIRLELAAEPLDFDNSVRKPGQSFLGKCPNPSSKDFKVANSSYWRLASKNLHDVYRNICAYSGLYLPLRSGTVDHFMPKVAHPQLAYEWTNLRLASDKMNMYKSDSQEVIDPIVVEAGWFLLEFPSCLMLPNAALPEIISAQVQKTINILKLNADDIYVQERCEIMLEYGAENVSIEYLVRRYPFIAAEIVRQNLNPQLVKALFKSKGT